jgi:hypothetical protein
MALGRFLSVVLDRFVAFKSDRDIPRLIGWRTQGPKCGLASPRRCGIGSETRPQGIQKDLTNL